MDMSGSRFTLERWLAWPSGRAGDFHLKATFADGQIPSYTVLDAQVNYAVPNLKSVFKLGGSNILGQEYFSAIGTGAVGSIFYLSWTVNP